MQYFLVGLIAAWIPALACAQASTPEDVASAYNAERWGMIKCARDYGVRFAATPALPQDIADAAIPACRQARLVDRAAKQKVLPLSGDALIDADDRQIAEMRRWVVQAVIEARYPPKR